MASSSEEHHSKLQTSFPSFKILLRSNYPQRNCRNTRAQNYVFFPRLRLLVNSIQNDKINYMPEDKIRSNSSTQSLYILTGSLERGWNSRQVGIYHSHLPLETEEQRFRLQQEERRTLGTNED